MKNRAIRIVLLVFALAAQGFVAYQLLRLDRQSETDQSAAAAFESEARHLLAAIGDLRAQQAAIAAGQGVSSLMKRSDAVVADIQTRVETLREMASSRGARGALSALDEALNGFRTTDEKVRKHLAADQRLMAADLVTESVAATAGMQERLEDARQAEKSHRLGLQPALNRTRYKYLGAASGATLLVMFLLLPRVTRKKQGEPAPEGAIKTSEDGDAAILDDDSLMLNLEPPGQPAKLVSTRTVDLAATAELCTEFARVVETSQLSSLLGRAAEIVGARGLIIWIADAEGRLTPALAHGYSPTALERMGTVNPDGDNAAASAFRHQKLETVSGLGPDASATAVPIVGPTGCTGVLTVEWSEPGDPDTAASAAAMLIAAQLAALIGAAPAAGESASR
jgi:hypothetical protein